MPAVEVGEGMPAPLLALAFARDDLARAGAQEVDVIDVVVVIGDGFHLNVLGRVQEPDLPVGRARAAGRNDEIGREAGLFAQFPQDRLIRELALVDVAAGGQPEAQLLVLEQQDLAVADRVGGDDEAVAFQEE